MLLLLLLLPPEMTLVLKEMTFVPSGRLFFVSSSSCAAFSSLFHYADCYLFVCLSFSPYHAQTNGQTMIANLKWVDPLRTCLAGCYLCLLGRSVVAMLVSLYRDSVRASYFFDGCLFQAGKEQLSLLLLALHERRGTTKIGSMMCV